MMLVWIGPLVACSFLVGLAASAVLVRLGKLGSPLRTLGALALPFGCASLPLAGIAAASVLVPIFATSNASLYGELLGKAAPADPGRLLFSRFGTGPTREILVRIEAKEPEARQLLSLPGLTASSMTPAAFVASGERHGLGAWWMAPYRKGEELPRLGSACLDPRILAADGFNGWKRLRVAVCAGGPRSPATLFVAAAGH